MKKILLLLFLISLSYLGNAQLKGLCIDNTTQTPIEYLNVSVKNTNIGTVTDTLGYFQLDGNFTEKDTLVFSHIGYNTKELAAKDKNLTVDLTPKIEILNEVVVFNNLKKIKTKEAGTKNKIKNISIQFIEDDSIATKDNLGVEIGKIIKVPKRKKYKLRELYFLVNNINAEEVTLRFNFYTINSNNNINKNRIYTSPIIKRITNKGSCTIDIEEEELYFDNDFLASIELISFKNKKEKNSPIISFASNVFNGPILYRYNPSNKWEQLKATLDIGVGISILVDVYK